MASLTETTRILRRVETGDPQSIKDLFPLVYDDLRSAARKLMARERTGHTLQATAIVHEAYSKLANSDVGWEGKTHLFCVAASALRRVLVDYARGRKTAKRGGKVPKVPVDAVEIAGPEGHLFEVIALEEALTDLEKRSPLQGRIFELYFFGGMKLVDVALKLGISRKKTVDQLGVAKGWLKSRLEGD